MGLAASKGAILKTATLITLTTRQEGEPLIVAECLENPKRTGTARKQHKNEIGMDKFV